MKKFQYVLVFCAFLIGLYAQVKTPSLTDAQKLKIRSAQVEFFQAKTALESTPQWNQFQAAQNKVNQAVAEVLKDSGVDQNKYRLEQTLEFTEIPQPKKEPAKEKK